MEYQPGKKVWVIEPVQPRALQDWSTGPYEIKERKGAVTSLVELQTFKTPVWDLHVNRLKPHFEKSNNAHGDRWW